MRAKTSKITICISIILCIAWIIVWAIISKRNISQYKVLLKENALDTTCVKAPYSSRGGLFYAPQCVVSCSCKLIENKDGFNNWKRASKNNPKDHIISHLSGPYYMFKKPNNDTIVVIKDGYVLKFKLPNSENQGRDFPPKSFSEFKENVGKAYTERYE